MGRFPACTLSPGLARFAGVTGAIYPLNGNQPARRVRGRVYTIDPALRRTENALSEISVPSEPLRDGLTGRLFAVDATDCQSGIPLCRPHLGQDGAGDLLDPGDPQSHCRNTYLVAMHVYEAFRRALGRPVAWSFWTEDHTPPLRLVPFGVEKLNAWYDPGAGEVRFGFGTVEGRPDGPLYRYTALSSDVVAHEVTHALLDGVRPGYDLPVNPDVAAFHEAFADIVALLSRFERPGYIEYLLRVSGHNLGATDTLINLAPELGRAVQKSGLRTLDVEWTSRGISDPSADLTHYDTAPEEPHDRGGLLASAVFEAFLRSVARRAQPFINVAGSQNGTAHSFLRDRIGEIAARTASHYLTICIRAIDYCPPAAIIFPDFLRALVTSDRLLSREDGHGYREDLIDAFRRRGILPEGSTVASDMAMSWQRPEIRDYAIPGLGLSEMRFDVLPTLPLSPGEIRRQATALAQAIDADPDLYLALGLRDPGSAPAGEPLSAPVITSIRPALRTGPDGYIDFSTIAEIVQIRTMRIPGSRFPVYLRGGATLICGASGRPRFIVRQRADNQIRLEQERDFVAQAVARGWLEPDGEGYAPAQDFRRLMCSAGVSHL